VGIRVLIYELIFFHIQHCFSCRPSDSTVPTDAGIEPRTVCKLQLVHWQSDALTTRSHPLNLSLPSYLYSCVKLFVFIIYLPTAWLSFPPCRAVPCVCEIIFLFLATWVAPLSSHFSTLGCWNLLSPGNFHLRAEGAEIRFREILCNFTLYNTLYKSYPPPPIPFLPPHLFSPPPSLITWISVFLYRHFFYSPFFLLLSFPSPPPLPITTPYSTPYSIGNPIPSYLQFQHNLSSILFQTAKYVPVHVSYGNFVKMINSHVIYIATYRLAWQTVCSFLWNFVYIWKNV